MEEKLAKTLGYPKTNPFGAPIPGYSAGLETKPTLLLTELLAGMAAVVERVPDEDSQLLEFFDQIGLKPGAEVMVVEAASFKGTATVLIDGREATLGMEVARSVLVSKWRER